MEQQMLQRLGLNRRAVALHGGFRGRAGANNYRFARVFHNGVHHRHQVAPLSPLKHEVRSERMRADGDVISYNGKDGQVGVYIAAYPLTPANNYFEVEILDIGILGAIGVGLVPQRYEHCRQPGWDGDSVGYHADDGRLFKGTSRHGRQFGPRCFAGDRIGCGVHFDTMAAADAPARDVVPVFFTHNGKEIGKVLWVHMPANGLYPCVGMHSEGEEVRLHLDAKWEHANIISMSIDNHEEDWARLHDVRLNGQLLEYTGRGKSIIDVGLAQSKYPLDTTNHYYEIQIVDPGDNCYIAIGLARKDYPQHRHPGWNKGSIAYHADDGKIFVGSGAGDDFGPKCAKGDIMGCGILFPRDYAPEPLDSDGSRDSPDVSDDEGTANDYLDAEDYHGAASSESEDEHWWERPHAHSGTSVQVFFTCNGKTIGHREIRIPKSGFYPTVGMLSSDEKVLVDLRPLTG